MVTVHGHCAWSLCKLQVNNGEIGPAKCQNICLTLYVCIQIYNSNACMSKFTGRCTTFNEQLKTIMLSVCIYRVIIFDTTKMPILRTG